MIWFLVLSMWTLLGTLALAGLLLKSESIRWPTWCPEESRCGFAVQVTLMLLCGPMAWLMLCLYLYDVWSGREAP